MLHDNKQSKCILFLLKTENVVNITKHYWT